MNKEREEINKRQRDFYQNFDKNLPSKIWSYFRNNALNSLKKQIGVEQDIYDLHKSWFGELSQKKVLDLGCYAGNVLSMHLAQHSKEYLGIDLSPKGIALFNRRLENIPGARAEVMDFLSEEFKEKDFDLIYAYGVLHHFKDVDELINTLLEKLVAGGEIISYDPLQTSKPIKFLRNIYRPFQSDRDWEWPFSKKTYYKFKMAFEIKERRAVLGKTKWSALIGFLPLSEEKKLTTARAWHQEDWDMSASSDEHMFSCMHLSMRMAKKPAK
ncbi:class I SAM-dependent methyltransferase [Salegentibacter mishustinae]|uniref:Methyltransferase n=1 Tax=Salegentibacter mishustinae TaxID=270918 RepID=A0A0Q9ZGB6_9FLAO|nr:class I SAM-dependent methyltransferase [Salegentibacter mishustinae]KRG28414.1 methyltransferase [Salegentibacter mishustinae]PNW22348.1 methyltransferase [Salegentibacter mishustinae]PZX67577.1 methyltransferase family protein [Salegentibacter mishustinae]GGW78824.1 methyltransferase [Salegentibacter mishustinae]